MRENVIIVERRVIWKKYFWCNEKHVESNTNIFSLKDKIEYEWDIEVSIAMEEEELALIITTPKLINYENN